MKRCMTMIAVLLATAATCRADARSVTFFSDGALVEVEATANRGIAEIALPGGMLEESLRIRPLANAVIQRVEILPARQEGKGARELELLLEQKSRLEDRLRALATREEIFKAAAKSQSAKAPRKTKANPEPMQAIRQGTDFAIAQLEAVYTARRRAEQEVRRLGARIAAAGKGRRERVARVAVAPKNGRVAARYALPGEGWLPGYDLRLENSGRARLTLYAGLPAGFAGYLLQASPATLAEGAGAHSLPVAAGSPARVAEYLLPSAGESFGDGLRPSFSCLLTNSTDLHLPAGEAALYVKGEYRGRFRFEGISSGRSRRVASGN